MRGHIMTFCKCTKITCVGVAKHEIGFEELRQVSSHSKPINSVVYRLLLSHKLFAELQT